MRQIHVTNRAMVNDLHLPCKYLLISVKDPEAPFVELSTDPNRVATMRLDFEDICSPQQGRQVFTYEQAAEIWAVVDKWHKDIDAIVCQCEAGISRSTAIAAALDRDINGEGKQAFYFNAFFPNTMVYGMLTGIREGRPTTKATLQIENQQLRERFTAPIICLCGSAKFDQYWRTIYAGFSDEGFIVLTLGRLSGFVTEETEPELKKTLDILHKRKIDLCDVVFVIDVDGYIGESTRSEIDYAETCGRPIVYLSESVGRWVEKMSEVLVKLHKKEKR